VRLSAHRGTGTFGVPLRIGVPAEHQLEFFGDSEAARLYAEALDRFERLGATPLVEPKKDKPTVIALREIASGKLGRELLNPPAPTPPVL